MIVRLTLAAIAVMFLSATAQAAGIMWVGAHPDDEVLASPMLRNMCITQQNKCVFVAFTNGDAGHCVLANGCYPNYGAFREAEFKRTATYFGGVSRILNLSNSLESTTDSVLSRWTTEAGGSTQLTGLMVEIINQHKPDSIVTFDSRHGSSCHPEHRIAAIVTYQAAQAVGFASNKIFMLEHKTITGTINGEVWAGFERIVPTDTAVTQFDGAALWSTVTDLMSIYTSQYYPSDVQATGRAPNANRFVSLLPLSGMVANDSRYTGLCQ